MSPKHSDSFRVFSGKWFCLSLAVIGIAGLNLGGCPFFEQLQNVMHSAASPSDGNGEVPGDNNAGQDADDSDTDGQDGSGQDTSDDSNQTPTANGQHVDVIFGTPITITLSGDDPDDGPSALVYFILELPTNGTLSESSGATFDSNEYAVAGNQVVYTPNADFVGEDGFAFKAYDGEAYSEPAAVRLSVQYHMFPQTKITVPGGTAGDNFGLLACSGDTLITGVYGDDDVGANVGAVHFFERISGTWMLDEKIPSPDAIPGQGFGYSVQIDGDVAVVYGRPFVYAEIFPDPADSFLYFYRRINGEWRLEAKIPDGGTGWEPSFCRSIALSGDTVAIGTAGGSEAAPSTGAAIVYRYSGGLWAQEAKLTPSSESALDEYGRSICIKDDLLIVGGCDAAPGFRVAYIYRRKNGVWVEEAKLSPLNDGKGQWYSASMVIDGDLAIIGAPRYSDGDQRVGAVCVFRNVDGTWAQEACLMASDASRDDHFGSSVAIENGVVVVGSPGDDDLGEGSGSVYVYRYTDGMWMQDAKLRALDGDSGDALGESVDIEGETVFASALGDKDGGFDTGACYVFELGDGGNEGEPLTATGRRLQVLYGTPTTVTLEGKSSDNSTAFTYKIKSLPTDGFLTDVNGTVIDSVDYVLSSDQVQYTPDAGYVGEDHFDFCVNSGNVSSETAKVVLPVSLPSIREEGELYSPGSIYQHSYGTTVGISGDTAVVSASTDGNDGDRSGAMFIFDRDNDVWSLEAKLTASDAAREDLFGTAAISGDTVIASAFWNDDAGEDSGCAYVFERNGGTWVETTKLLPPDVSAGDQFGISIEMDGDTAAISATHDDGTGNRYCVWYIYRRVDGVWEEEKQITPVDLDDGDGCGGLAIDGNAIVVGGCREEIGGEWSYSMYIFHREGAAWTRQEKVAVPNLIKDSGFLASLDICGDTIVVGANEDARDSGDDDFRSGSVYVFSRTGDTWAYSGRLIASDAREGAWFGYSVAICGDEIVVGAPQHWSAYVFRKTNNGWMQQKKLEAAANHDRHFWGCTLAVDNGTIVIGSRAALVQVFR